MGWVIMVEMEGEWVVYSGLYSTRCQAEEAMRHFQDTEGSDLRVSKMERSHEPLHN